MKTVKDYLFIIRDIAIFVILMLLIRMELKKNISFLLHHKKSLIHQLDQDFLDQLHTFERQVYQYENYLLDSPFHKEYKDKIDSLKDHLAAIKDKYVKNSPGLMLLGPLGSTAIVMKERQLKESILVIINELGKIISTSLSPEKTPFIPKKDINSALLQNKKLLILVTH